MAALIETFRIEAAGDGINDSAYSCALPVDDTQLFLGLFREQAITSAYIQQ